jgi:hypothetical protein
VNIMNGSSTLEGEIEVRLESSGVMFSLIFVICLTCLIAPIELFLARNSDRSQSPDPQSLESQ